MGLTVDEVCNSLRLRKVHAAIEKRPLGKFTRFRYSDTEIEKPLQHLIQNDGGSVAMQLERVLPGIGMRSLKKHRYRLVDGTAVSVFQNSGCRNAGVREKAKESLRYFSNLRAGYTNDTDAAHTGRAGLGRYGLFRSIHYR